MIHCTSATTQQSDKTESKFKLWDNCVFPKKKIVHEVHEYDIYIVVTIVEAGEIVELSFSINKRINN